MVSLIAFEMQEETVYINPAEISSVESFGFGTRIRMTNDCSYKIITPLAETVARLAFSGVIVFEKGD